MAASVNVLTNRYDNSRTGCNLTETVLNPSTVNPDQFGLLFSRTVDGQIYSQPLIVSNVQVTANSSRPVVYVATANNNVYCFDAEDETVVSPYWQINLGLPVPNTDYGNFYSDFLQNIGIVSTPAIDIDLGAIWVVAKSKEAKSNGAHYVYSLHALDLTNGSEKFGGPVRIADSLHDAFVSGPTFPGSGVNPPNGVPSGMVGLSAYRHLNRPGLLLSGGVLYIAFGSHGDQDPYHGWILAYDAVHLSLLAVYCNTPNSGEGGIWQSGNGLAADDQGFVYAVAGNGTITVGTSTTEANFGCNAVKLQLASGQLNVVDWFSPFDTQLLNQNDVDLCSGPVFLPGTNFMMASGKDGKFYVLDRAKMGKFVAGGNNSQIHQVFQAAIYHIHGTPPCWARGTDTLAYVWSEVDALKAYKFAGGMFQIIPDSMSTMSLPPDEHHMPGGILTVSANGTATDSGVLWATHPVCGDANHGTVDGILRAFDANDVSNELWNSEMAGDHSDRLGNLAKFNPPVVANGQVYVGTFSDVLRVYGLLKTPRPLAPCATGWQQRDIGADVFGFAALSCDKFTVNGGGSDIWNTADGFHFLFRTFTGDGEIIAKVSTMNATSPWAKSGVMFRESLDPGSRNAMTALTIGNGVAFQRRLNTGDISVTTAVPNVSAPYWAKLTRQGNTFTSFISSDGVNWGTAVGSDTVVMPASLFVGLAVSSHAIDQRDSQGNINACVQNNTVFMSVSIS